MKETEIIILLTNNCNVYKLEKKHDMYTKHRNICVKNSIKENKIEVYLQDQYVYKTVYKHVRFLDRVIPLRPRT